jgi:hypothetical protein
MPSLVSATWSAWRAANLPPPGTFAERDFASAIVKLGVRVPRSARTAGSVSKIAKITWRKGIKASASKPAAKLSQSIGQAMAPASSGSWAPACWAAKAPT